MKCSTTLAPSKKAVLIGTSLGDSPVSRHFAALARELVDMRYSVTLLVHGQQNDRSYVDPRVSVLRWPSLRATGLANALFFNGILREHRPCCIVSNFGAINSMSVLGARHRVPVRIIWHHTLSSQNLLDAHKNSLVMRLQILRAKIVWRCATHFVGNSNAAKHDLVQIFGFPASRCWVFWNCMDDPMSPDEVLPETVSESKSHYVCVGRFAHSKGQDIVVRAVAAAVKYIPDVIVEFIGDGERKETCRRLAAELGVAGHCSFSGCLLHGDVLKKMASARATIVPSRAEAFGLVCIESLAVGVPVIGSRTGGIAEVVRDRVDGLLFPPEDHAALARQMIELVHNQRLHRQMAIDGRRRFLENFEISKAVAGQARWFDSIIAKSERS